MNDPGSRPPKAEAPRSTVARYDELEVTIEKLVAGGDGLARHEGLPIFVARSAPGDRCRVRVSERKPGYARADLVELLTEGPGRRTPVCRHFGDCGGCDLQHIEDALQVPYKVAATVETLERMARLQLPEPEVLAGKAWNYRTRTQLHGAVSAAVDGKPRASVGYHARGSHRLVVVEECPVLVEELELAVRRLPALLGADPPKRIDLTVGDAGRLSCAPVFGNLPHGEVTVKVGDYEYAYDALRSGPLATLDVARRVLGLEGHPGAASAAVFTLLGRDERFQVDNVGIWSLADGATPPGPPLDQVRFAVVGNAVVFGVDVWIVFQPVDSG